MSNAQPEHPEGQPSSGTRSPSGRDSPSSVLAGIQQESCSNFTLEQSMQIISKEALEIQQ